DLLQTDPDRLGVPRSVGPDERKRDRRMDGRAGLIGDPPAEHLQMAGHAMAQRHLKALRARAPVARIEAIDRRAIADDRPRRRELAERERQGSLEVRDRKSTRLNSSHVAISYAVFCLKKKRVALTPYLMHVIHCSLAA